MTSINLNLLQNSWTAIVELKNGQITPVWYTGWPMIKIIVKNVLSVSSDFPRHKLS